MGPLPNGRFMAYCKWGVIRITTYKSWDDPPSKQQASLQTTPEGEPDQGAFESKDVRVPSASMVVILTPY